MSRQVSGSQSFAARANALRALLRSRCSRWLPVACGRGTKTRAPRSRARDCCNASLPCLVNCQPHACCARGARAVAGCRLPVAEARRPEHLDLACETVAMLPCRASSTVNRTPVALAVAGCELPVAQARRPERPDLARETVATLPCSVSSTGNRQPATVMLRSRLPVASCRWPRHEDPSAPISRARLSQRFPAVPRQLATVNRPP
jgi:hypothetical protein